MELLRQLADRYEVEDFINDDPIQIPRRYMQKGRSPFARKDARANIEILAFVVSWISWGSRKQIIEKADYIDREIFKGRPYEYIMGVNTRSCTPEWRRLKGNQYHFYRTFTIGDFHDLCNMLYNIYSNYDNMEKAVKAGMATTENKTPLYILRCLFPGVKGIPSFLNTSSACKRLNMFLRWMCRKGSPVDIGLWNLGAKDLLIPLDTHVHKQALNFGLSNRKTADMKAVVEITDKLKEVFPDDPTRGDFALFGSGVRVNQVINEFENMTSVKSFIDRIYPKQERERIKTELELNDEEFDCIAYIDRRGDIFDRIKTTGRSVHSDTKGNSMMFENGKRVKEFSPRKIDLHE